MTLLDRRLRGYTRWVTQHRETACQDFWQHIRFLHDSAGAFYHVLHLLEQEHKQLCRIPADEQTGLDRKIGEYVEWFTANHARWTGIRDPKLQLKFLDEAIGGAAYIAVRLYREFRQAQGEQVVGAIWMPEEWCPTPRGGVRHG